MLRNDVPLTRAVSIFSRSGLLQTVHVLGIGWPAPFLGAKSHALTAHCPFPYNLSVIPSSAVRCSWLVRDSITALPRGFQPEPLVFWATVCLARLPSAFRCSWK